ncbi:MULTISPECIES: hypothetical protein [Chryseobacterium]|uniref:Translation elongation factor EF-Tu-like GTPase n=1 Tax=Chryseobacterium camelliae TaxID=1265445 RepID=A0ABU0TIF1_9FLAO|nr:MULTISPECIES: hypothetical protein [Chryseobacterium]MDT3409303.1 translation elongation factor EF-Tu-like GTPase [Pseudacidovorax intermedius]MDQ1096833.1 translation elongation factor EF-Tu-like GTPase [Chryseobacterium camelliae]MDQ1100774.1 translation elongation factor EF-Tu-like GTPase [Chryseobacterium sp. SORGH_AS_1048]MDR6084218.1 translation elongation factor EF-Tu-like GTPase [Chryseobacterium sp. SORGH_AS_0909]MDR6132490.1 translation elongation factor EF-Tu-like GTPase [Chryseo
MKIKSHFTAQLSFAPESKGGRSTPVSSGYRPAIQFPPQQDMITCVQTYPDTELVFLGDTVQAEIALLNAEEIISSLYEGQDFDFFEGPDLIGHGTITKVH